MYRKRQSLGFLGMLMVALFVLSACDGANSSSWRNVRNNVEEVLPYNGGFSISVDSATSGRRNRTFEMTQDQLDYMLVLSESESGSIILTISQDGKLDGSETVLDVSNFREGISLANMEPGPIRFSLEFEDIVNSNTLIRWR